MRPGACVSISLSLSLSVSPSAYCLFIRLLAHRIILVALSLLAETPHDFMFYWRWEFVLTNVLSTSGRRFPTLCALPFAFFHLSRHPVLVRVVLPETFVHLVRSCMSCVLPPLPSSTFRARSSAWYSRQPCASFRILRSPAFTVFHLLCAWLCAAWH